jgi:hypothetical protein
MRYSATHNTHSIQRNQQHTQHLQRSQQHKALHTWSLRSVLATSNPFNTTHHKPHRNRHRLSNPHTQTYLVPQVRVGHLQPLLARSQVQLALLRHQRLAHAVRDAALVEGLVGRDLRR